MKSFKAIVYYYHDLFIYVQPTTYQKAQEN